MRKFDIELAKQGAPICTRDGKPARIICYDAYNAQPVIALVTLSDGVEYPYTYDKDGRYILGTTNENDLIMKPEKHEGWIHIYERDGKKSVAGRAIFETREEAMESLSTHNNEGRVVDTIRIEWEE